MNNFEVELKLNKSTKPLSRWKIFLFTSILVFIFTTLQNIGLTNFNLLSPLPSFNSALNKALPKLEEKPNNFKLKKSTSLVESSFASLDNFQTLNAYLAVDYDTGEIILGKNLSKKFSIASLTKIMTAIVSLDLESPNEKLIISKNSASVEPTKIGVVENQKMTVEELLNALLLTSANDAAQALKDGINKKYGGEVFVKAMNAKALYIGLKNTNFSNPQGFDNDKNFSSVEDLAILSRYAINTYPVISKIVKKDYEFLPQNSDHKQFDLYNWNGLLDVYPGVKGLKIGNTDSAGYTTAVLSEREGKKIIVVLLGAPGVLERDLWASQVLDSAFKKLSDLPPIELTARGLRQKYSTWKYWN